jgi:hypothetical protein
MSVHEYISFLLSDIMLCGLVGHAMQAVEDEGGVDGSDIVASRAIVFQQE